MAHNVQDVKATNGARSRGILTLTAVAKLLHFNLISCADTIFMEGPPPPIGVAKGESLTVEIEAHADPEALSASVLEVGTTNVVQIVELETALRSELQLDQEPDVYTVHVNGRWDVGDIFYAFQIEVR